MSYQEVYGHLQRHPLADTQRHQQAPQQVNNSNNANPPGPPPLQPQQSYGIDDLVYGVQTVSLGGYGGYHLSQQAYVNENFLNRQKPRYGPMVKDVQTVQVGFPSDLTGLMVGSKGSHRTDLMARSGVSALSFNPGQATITGSQAAVRHCQSLIEQVVVAKRGQVAMPVHRPLAALPSTPTGLDLNDYVEWSHLFGYVERSARVRIETSSQQQKLWVTSGGTRPAAIEMATEALNRLRDAEAFVVVTITAAGSPAKGTKSQMELPLTGAQAKAIQAELEELPEIMEYRNGPPRKLRGVREKDVISFQKRGDGRLMVIVNSNKRDCDSVSRVLEPLFWGKAPVEGWEKWLAGGFGWEFARNQAATRGEWTGKFQACRELLVAANEMAGAAQPLKELLFYKDPATGGSTQRLRGSGGRYEEVITDVRKFLEFLMFCSVSGAKGGRQGSDRMWERIEKICTRSSDFKGGDSYNGGLLRSSNRGPDVPCQWSAHAHESIHPFAMVTEESQRELLAGVEYITRLLIQDIAGYEVEDVRQWIKADAQNRDLSVLEQGEVVEIMSGNLKGQAFRFDKWTTSDQLSAKLLRLDDGEPLPRSVKRSLLKKKGEPPSYIPV